MKTESNTTSTHFEAEDSHFANSSSEGWSGKASEAYGDFQAYYSGNKGSDKVVQVGNVVQADSKPQCYLDWAGQHFEILDTDHNGFISAEEIDGGYHDSAIAKEQHHVLNGLRTFYDEIQSASNDEWFVENDGITRQDLASYRRTQLDRNLEASKRRSKVDE